MKQKVDKTDAESKVNSKKARITKGNPQKTETNNTKEKPMVNGNRKRKAQIESNPMELKKVTDDEESKIPEKEEAKSSGDMEIENTIPSGKKKNGGKLKRNIIPTSSDKVHSATSVKRQKVALQVPTLPTISGVLFVMGINDVGQIGMEVPTISRKKRPTELLHPSHQFVDIAAGAMHSVCLTNRGEVYTFGCNDEGALGRVTEEQDDECIPAKVDIPGVVVQISAGDSHSAALIESGQVYIWGSFRNSNGMIGLIKSGVKCHVPQRILHHTTIVRIASGSDHFVALSDDGQAYTCGNAEVGQLGRIPERSCKGDSRKGFAEHLEAKAMILRSNAKPITDIWAGHSNTYIKVKDGSIYGCGLNNFHQLGLPVVNDEHGEPMKFMYFVPTLLNSFDRNLHWKHISVGQHHSLALDGKGEVYTLGRKEYGRLGLGENCTDAETPTIIPALKNKKSVDISCGNIVSFAVTDDGIIHSWGFGENHQLGHGSEDDVYVPTPVVGNFQNSWYATKVSGGGQHTLILANKKGTTNETEVKK